MAVMRPGSIDGPSRRVSGGICLDESGRAPGLVLCNFTCLTHFIHANDVCDILLNYYNTLYKVQNVLLQYYNTTFQSAPAVLSARLTSKHVRRCIEMIRH